MLLLAHDERGVGMSERQVRDEVMTLLLAGHETTAITLTWAFLLDRHPEARRRLEEELAHVLGERPAAPDDVPTLEYTQAVINETLRLYPPAYVTGREAVRATTVGGRAIPKRHIILISMYATHRDPASSPNQTRSDPSVGLTASRSAFRGGRSSPSGWARASASARRSP